ncbi:hypothetical protein ACFWAN_48170 [Streptomyces mirabilis]
MTASACNPSRTARRSAVTVVTVRTAIRVRSLVRRARTTHYRPHTRAAS